MSFQKMQDPYKAAKEAAMVRSEPVRDNLAIEASAFVIDSRYGYRATITGEGVGRDRQFWEVDLPMKQVATQMYYERMGDWLNEPRHFPTSKEALDHAANALAGIDEMHALLWSSARPDLEEETPK